MADAAFSLALTLLSEIHFNELEFVVDRAGVDGSYQSDVRRATVAKVLESKIGAADEITVNRVVEFLPQVIADEPIRLNQIAELADLIRNNLSLPDHV